ncbi:MAG: GDSL-type esterase/lipase family protein [Planctomycetaceae bacterium]
MTDFTLPRPVQLQNLSSGFIGTLGCWIAGAGLTAAAIVFSVSGGLTTRLIGLAALFAGALICGVARTAPAQWKLRFTAVFVTLCMTLVLAEIVLRLVTRYPVSTENSVVPHSALGFVLNPEQTDVDTNGFRNVETATQAEIVAIGDSHTQGMNVAAAEAWPQLLGQQLKRSVYNMGIGEYGPLHYDVLISEALKLQPKHIVVGLSLGNDLGDIGRGIQQRHSEREIDNAFRHNLKFRTATGNAIHHLVKRSRIGRPAGFEIPHANSPTFVSDQRVRFLSADMDASDPRIAAALQQTIQILTSARQRCDAAGTKLIVLLIPTRESAYSHSPHSAVESWPNALKQMVQRETDVRVRLQAALQEQQIECVDLLPLLTAAVDSDTRVYAAHDEGHPIASGYQLYASAVAGAIRQ